MDCNKNPLKFLEPPPKKYSFWRFIIIDFTPHKNKKQEK